MEELIKWNWRALQAGSPLFDFAKEALEFGKRALLVKSLLEMTIGSFVSCLFSIWEETFQDLISPVPATKQGEHWNGSFYKLLNKYWGFFIYYSIYYFNRFMVMVSCSEDDRESHQSNE
jgi:hypothetical protein